MLLRQKQPKYKDKKLSDKEVCDKVLKGLGPNYKTAWQIGITKVGQANLISSLYSG